MLILSAAKAAESAVQIAGEIEEKQDHDHQQQDATDAGRTISVVAKPTAAEDQHYQQDDEQHGGISERCGQVTRENGFRHGSEFPEHPEKSEPECAAGQEYYDQIPAAARLSPGERIVVVAAHLRLAFFAKALSSTSVL